MHLKHLIIIVVVFSLGKSPTEYTIAWDASRKLTWNDFKAAPDLDSNAAALTASGLTFGYSVKTADKRIVNVKTTVEAHFYPNKSWYIKDKGDSHILKHEQLHFDITELYARKFREQLSHLPIHRTITKQMDKMHLDINEALNETQKRYDKETKHSLNRELQKQWEETIFKELKALDQFKSQ